MAVSFSRSIQFRQLFLQKRSGFSGSGYLVTTRFSDSGNRANNIDGRAQSGDEPFWVMMFGTLHLFTFLMAGANVVTGFFGQARRYGEEFALSLVCVPDRHAVGYHHSFQYRYLKYPDFQPGGAEQSTVLHPVFLC
jgi:hypothetical protein